MNQQPLRSPRTIGRIVLKIVFLVVGVLLTEFGLLGGSLEATGPSSPIGCFVFAVSLIALIGSIFVFFNKEYYLHCLPRLQYLYWSLGAACAFIVLLGIVFGVAQPNTNPMASAIAAGVILLYGISFMWIAYMKPSVAQQMNESIYHIVKRMPGEQIIVFELLARLQKRYKQEATTLYQSFERLEYIELVNTPGAPGLICRIKQQAQVAPTVPVAPPHVSGSLLQVGLMPSPSQIPAKHIETPLPGRANFPTELRLAGTNKPLADLETVPMLPAIAISRQTPPSSPAQPATQIDLKPASPLTPSPVQHMVSPGQQPINATIQHTMPPKSQLVDAVTPPNQIVTPDLSVSKNSKQHSPFVKEQKAIQIFCCYAHEDEQILEKLKTHLKPQQRQGLIHIWHDRDIHAGADWEQEIEEQLNTAQIILLLVSADFMASDYCYTKEMQRVLARHTRGEVRAIPIILRPVDWKITPLGKLQALPKDGKPVTTWSNRENAYLDVATGIRMVVETFFNPPDKKPPVQPAQRQAKPLTNVQRPEAEVEFIRARCTQGKLIITNKKITIELTAFGKVIKSQTLLKSSLTGVDSKLAVPSVFGMGGGMNLTFYGKGRERLRAELVPLKEAREILGLLG